MDDDRRSLHPVAGFSLLEVMVVLAIVAALSLLAVAGIDRTQEDWRFDQTGLIMERVRSAIIGTPGLYSNGVPQHTGYVADMGRLPGLFRLDPRVRQAVSVAAVDLRDSETIEQILRRNLVVQPRALWTRDLNGDGTNELSEEILWQFHPAEKIWAGWRGPYLPAPDGGVLRDAWGHSLIFLIGELVTVNDSASGTAETYRCLQTHDSGLEDEDPSAVPPQPGPHDPRHDQQHWQKLPLHLNAPRWWLDEQEKERWFPPGDGGIFVGDRYLVREAYYDDALVIISLGRDGAPGGSGPDADLLLTIYTDEYTGEVGGHAGYGGSGNHSASVTLHYPAYTETTGRILTKTIHMQDDDRGYGVNFCFGGNRVRAIEAWECSCQDTAADCTCVAYKDTTCLSWGWDAGSPPFENGVYDSDWYSWYGCVRTSDQGVACPNDLMCYPVSCSSNPTATWHPTFEAPVCLEEEQDTSSPCLTWNCRRRPLAAGIDDEEDCFCTAVYEQVDAAATANYTTVAVPIGVRSLEAGNGPLVFTISPGANWVGTVR
jgi:prepilin-type N-terminal cleavage/methylation domain-containing protein